jgi:hypothetical protein
LAVAFFPIAVAAKTMPAHCAGLARALPARQHATEEVAAEDVTI